MNVFEIVGVLAVIISLLFVAYQIQQANRIAIGSATLAVQQMYLDLVNTFLQEPGLADLAAKLANEEHSLTPQETQLAMAYGQKYFVIWDAIWAAYENGLISERTFWIYNETPSDILLRWPGLVPHMLHILESWGITTDNYTISDHIQEKSIHSTFLAKVVSSGMIEKAG